MSSFQEIKEIAEELQLRGDEKKNFIIEQMDKLRKLQAEKEEREAKLQAEKEQRETEAKLQAEKEEREAKLKMEEMRTQSYQRYKHRKVSKVSTTLHQAAQDRSMKERILNLRWLNYRLLWTEKMTLILGYFGLSDSLPQVDGPRKAGAHHYQHCWQEERKKRFVVSQRPRPQIMIVSRKSYKRDITWQKAAIGSDSALVHQRRERTPACSSSASRHT